MATAEEHLAKAQRFLATAKLATDDGDVDSGVSRAEYAVHHAMIALLLHTGAAANIHEASKAKIQTDFANLTARRYSEIHRFRLYAGSRNLRRSLSELSEARNVADYRVPGAGRNDSTSVGRFARRLVEAVAFAIGGQQV